MSLFSSWRGRLVENLSGSVLEIGVGAGENLRYYRRADVIHAIEPDAERARQAEDVAAAVTHGIPIHIQVAPAEELPYADSMFDVVVSSLVFCSVTDQDRALAEIERVLRPEGVLWMVEHVRPKTPILAQFAAAVTPQWRKIAHNCHLDRPTLSVLERRGWRVDVLRRRGVFVKVRATR